MIKKLMILFNLCSIEIIIFSQTTNIPYNKLRIKEMYDYTHSKLKFNNDDGIVNYIFSIVNQLGYILENLINKERRAGGQYKIKFEGKNYKEGMYYCILKVNGQIIGTQKMIILK
jgi:hypothetical protein